jgi:hypothetical protein
MAEETFLTPNIEYITRVLLEGGTVPGCKFQGQQ